MPQFTLSALIASQEEDGPVNVKPSITKVGTEWICSSQAAFGVGATPVESYDNWQDNLIYTVDEFNDFEAAAYERTHLSRGGPTLQ